MMIYGIFMEYFRAEALQEMGLLYSNQSVPLRFDLEPTTIILSDGGRRAYVALKVISEYL